MKRQRNKRILLPVLILLMLLLGAPKALMEEQAVLLTLEDGETLFYEPYSLYMDVAAAISQYSTRQGIAFTRAMESYLEANHVILATDEFSMLCAEEMEEYLRSETFMVCKGILKTQGGLTDEEIVRCVWENYWSQYVARTMAGFFNAQHEMNGESASEMFQDFTQQFYAHLEFPDDESVAVFAGEEIPWEDVYRNLCAYNELTARLEIADTLAQNRCVEKYLNEHGIHVDLTGMEESIDQAVSTMRSNELYCRVLDGVLAKYGRTLEEFLDAMRPFVLANFQRAAFGQHCYDLYQAGKDSTTLPDPSSHESDLPQEMGAEREADESGETKNETSEDMEDMEDFYYGKLASVCQTYSIGYLGW